MPLAFMGRGEDWPLPDANAITMIAKIIKKTNTPAATRINIFGSMPFFIWATDPETSTPNASRPALDFFRFFPAAIAMKTQVINEWFAI